MSKYFFVILILFIFFDLSKAQESYLKKQCFTKFNLGYKGKVLDYVVSDTIFNKKKPVLIFIQGSGPLPLFFYHNNDTFNFLPINYNKYYNDFRLVLINKQGVGLIDDYNKNYFIRENLSIPYLEYTDLKHRVNVTKKIITHLKKQNWVTDIYIVGHSEGYRVVASVAKRNRKIKKVVCMSANPFNRFAQFRLEERIKSIKGLETDSIVDKNIDSLYNSFEILPQLEFDKAQQFEKLYFENEISYNYTFSIDDLLITKIPILVTYGTADIGSLDNDLLPYFFKKNNKDNLLIKKYTSLDHNYRLLSKEGKVIERHWNDVFDDVVTWLLTNKIKNASNK